MWYFFVFLVFGSKGNLEGPRALYYSLTQRQGMWVNHMGALKELWQQIEANVLPKSYYYNYHCDYNNNLYIFIIHNQLLAAINPDQIIHFSHSALA